MASLPSSSQDLVVLTPSSPSEFASAITSRCYNAKRPARDCYPDIIFQAKSVAAVQTAVRYCVDRKLKICVRSGGHNWEGSWLQGSGTALLDVGDLNSIELHQADKSVHVGPGATGSAIVQALAPHDLFFPGGHCDGVAIGGFLLGGGYGIGFPKYGMGSTWVSQARVVLPDGSVVTASSSHEKSDPKQAAILHLIRGAYTAFPGVITSYTLGPSLPTKPKGVMSGTLFYKLTDWPKAFDLAKTIHKDGNDAIEITSVMTYAPPAVQEATGESMVTLLGLMIWGDTPEESWELWKRYGSTAEGLLVPPEEMPTQLEAENVPAFFKDLYPSSTRYQTQVFMGDKAFETLQGTEEMESLIQPLVDMWMSDDKPPAPSHTLLVCVHPNLKSKVHGNQELALGYTPDMGIQTYAMYTDAGQDDTIKEQLDKAHAKFVECDKFHTSLVEGETKRHGYESGFACHEAFLKTRQCIQLLDPDGVFAGCPK
ncbi:bridge enzyme-like [Seminavis robusta]|uniref:Bridge enzyme-like n=1 Tax=Seminavis robusta TaxID=568900 RepID=A0A9N8EJ82_9STRA|nr:bridge enzyme-like [Seminavis robusta]|eukprot:Sro1267_g257630.1 bridge enzyme-like (483) ;mRNA; f:2662-4110